MPSADGQPVGGPASENAEEVPHAPELNPRERREVASRTAIRAQVVHEAIRQEGEVELGRSVGALWWSGLAAGLSMGFSLIAQGVLLADLPAAPWRPLVTTFGYCLGFLIVVLGRQQLFTENTLTVILPLLARRNGATLAKVVRLWAVVLAANLAGAFLVSWVIGNTDVFRPGVRAAFTEIAGSALEGNFLTLLLRGIFAGWLIALMVWLLPIAEAARLHVIIILSYVVGLAGLAHIVAGSVEVLYLVSTGGATWADFCWHFVAPTLLGNIVGGVSLVAVLNHAQVISGE